MEEQIDNSKFIIQRYDNYIAGANVKGNFLLAFNTFLTGGIVTNYSKIKELVGCGVGETLLNVSLCILLIASLATTIFVIKAVYPFLSSGNSSKDKYHSHIYFKSVSEFENAKSYNDSFSKLTPEEFKLDLSNQTYELAKGLKKKYNFLKWSMLFIYFEIFLILLILAIIIFL